MELNVNISVGSAGISATSGGGGEGGESWLVAMAKAMGTMLGQKAADMVETTDLMEQQMGDSPEEAKEFSRLQTEFQAQSQMFSMLSNTVSTALKSIGEGLTANARKQ